MTSATTISWPTLCRATPNDLDGLACRADSSSAQSTTSLNCRRQRAAESGMRYESKGVEFCSRETPHVLSFWLKDPL